METEEMTKYEWRITIGIQRHWVTTEEKDVYLNSISKGMDLVPLRGGTLFLGKNAQEIIHGSALKQSQQIEEYRKEGKYQCDHGTWHPIGSSCYCNIEAVEVEEGVLRLQEKSNKPLLEEPLEKKRYPVARHLTGSIKTF